MGKWLQGQSLTVYPKLCVSQVSLGFSFPILPTPQCVRFLYHHYPMLRSQVCIAILNLFCFVFRHVCVSKTIGKLTNVSSDCSIYPPAPGQESPLRWAGMRFEEVPVAHIKATHNK